MSKPHRNLSQSRNVHPYRSEVDSQGTDRITRIDSDADIQSRSNRVPRRRLTAPGPTPLRDQIVVEDEGRERNLTPEVVNVDDARLALVPSQSQLPSLLQEMSTSSPEVKAFLGWTAVGTFFVKIVLIILPCSPYICSAMVLYPLLALASLDVFLYSTPR